MADQEDQGAADRQAEPKGPAIMGISVLAAAVVLLVGALVEIGIAQVCSRTECGGSATDALRNGICILASS